MKRQKNHFKIYKIDGVGVNLERFYPCASSEEKIALREKYGFSADDFILIYIAEFIPRKNHKLLFDIRGHNDVIEDCVNGFLFATVDVSGFEKAILTLYKNPALRCEMKIYEELLK